MNHTELLGDKLKTSLILVTLDLSFELPQLNLLPR